MTNVFVTPTINLNGSSKETLIEDIMTASDTLRTAIAAFQRVCPHGRDYPSADGALLTRIARDQWSEQADALYAAAHYLEQMGIAIVEQER